MNFIVHPEVQLNQPAFLVPIARVNTLWNAACKSPRQRQSTSLGSSRHEADTSWKRPAT